MMEFFNLEAYGHTLQIGYQIYLTRLATHCDKIQFLVSKFKVLILLIKPKKYLFKSFQRFVEEKLL